MKFSIFLNKVLITLLSVYAGQLLFVSPVIATSATNMQVKDAQYKGPTGGTKTTNKKSKCRKIANKDGTKNTHKVPEPLTILGVGATLGSLPIFKKYYNKKNK